MIKDITIENYKGFKYLKVPNCRRINLITGKNNVGKSSLLEAIFTMQDKQDIHNAFTKEAQWRDYHINTYNNNCIKEIYKPFFYDFDMTKSIGLTKTYTDNTSEKVHISFHEDDNFSIKLNIKNLYNQLLKAEYDIVFTESLGNDDMANRRIEKKQIFKKNEDNYINKVGLTKYTSSWLQNSTNPVEALSKCKMAKKDDELIEYLKIIEPKLKKLEILSKTEFAKQQIIFADVNLQELIPINMMGQGFASVLCLFSYIVSEKSYIILVDEIENGIHYSLYDKLWQSLLKLAEDYNSQLFITTHSYEMIASFSKVQLQNDKKCSYYELFDAHGISLNHVSADVLEDKIKNHGRFRGE
ncbi:MAG: AAA family ATPase [Phycisphaerales bacterium]|nr:AAA family ATPase [Phycisphaerales bacterium]